MYSIQACCCCVWPPGVRAHGGLLRGPGPSARACSSVGGSVVVRRTLTAVAALLATLVSLSAALAQENSIDESMEVMIAATSAGKTWTVSDPLAGSRSLPTPAVAGKDSMVTTPGDGESRRARTGLTGVSSEPLAIGESNQWTPWSLGCSRGAVRSCWRLPSSSSEDRPNSRVLISQRVSSYRILNAFAVSTRRYADPDLTSSTWDDARFGRRRRGSCVSRTLPPIRMSRRV